MQQQEKDNNEENMPERLKRVEQWKILINLDLHFTWKVKGRNCFNTVKNYIICSITKNECGDICHVTLLKRSNQWI